MPLAPGSRIGPFEIVALLGQGGMGEVWRARDTKLEREVAIKALPEEFALDVERRGRLEREAQLLAALNHPNVAAIYGLEESGGSGFLVLELVEGETLADRLAPGPLPVPETLSFAAQIAAGLEAAHEAGVIHRDLKPSNVKVRPDGSVKILDLGLARTAEPSGTSTDVSLSPTVTSGGTSSGVILGTAPYMSPEQARGRPLDRRTDIFSFGGLLFECLTGQRAFHGATVSDTLAAVLTAEPNWSALPASLPPRLTTLLRRCLQKDPKQRLHDIGDARLELEELRAGPASGEAAAAQAQPAREPRRAIAAAIIGLTLGGAAGFLAARSPSRPAAAPAAVSLRAVLPLPDGAALVPGARPSIAISPDGRTVVFRANFRGVGRLWRRALDGSEAEPIAGTEGGSGPFFSPDGQWLGFFTVDSLKKVPLTGGTAIPVCDMPPVAQGATWLPDGSIVFNQQSNGGLYRIAASGAKIEPFTTLDAARAEHAHSWPQALPRGRGILVTIVRGLDFQDIDSAEAVVLEPGTARRHVLLEGCSFARYVPGGWILFLRGRSLFAVAFDLDRLEVAGPPRPISEPITVGSVSRIAHFAASSDGALVYTSGPPVPERATRVVRLDREGHAATLLLPPGNTSHPKLSPDGKRLAVGRCTGQSCKLHVFDLDRQVLSPLTPEPGRFFCPVWSPDGRQVAFTQFHEGQPRLAVKAADGSGGLQTLTPQTGDAEFPGSFSPDGSLLAYTLHYLADRGGTRQRGSSDIWLLPMDGKSPAHPWFESPFSEFGAEFSPDGRWIAYVSAETGRKEVYVRPFPRPGGKLKISADGGAEPAWSRGGREILYRQGDEVMAAEFRATAEPSASAPRRLFPAKLLDAGGSEDGPREYEVLRDGAEILGIQGDPPEPVERRLTIVTNWTLTLARSAPGK